MSADGDGSQRADEALLAQLGEGFVLIVGRMEGDRYKGHEDLLATLARLAPAHPELRLVIVGEGKDRARLEARARELGVAERATFTGFVDAATLSAIYRRCAVFAMPSDGEGFGLVYLEAMRAGKPCVALAGSAAAEIIVDGSTGRLVPPGVAPLEHALGELLSDPGATAAMGAAGRERWQRAFQPALFAENLRPHLETLLAEARP
jgi:glycosyltransferase involved in cell wall biosynthesis